MRRNLLILTTVLLFYEDFVHSQDFESSKYWSQFEWTPINPPDPVDRLDHQIQDESQYPHHPKFVVVRKRKPLKISWRELSSSTKPPRLKRQRIPSDIGFDELVIQKNNPVTESSEISNTPIIIEEIVQQIQQDDNNPTQSSAIQDPEEDSLSNSELSFDNFPVIENPIKDLTLDIQNSEPNSETSEESTVKEAAQVFEATLNVFIPEQILEQPDLEIPEEESNETSTPEFIETATAFFGATPTQRYVCKILHQY